MTFWTDERLLAELSAAAAPPDVPAGVLEGARAVYGWRTVDAELAALLYDSATSSSLPAAVRGEPATLRSLTFTAPDLVIDLELDATGLAGQVVPARPGTVLVHSPGAGDASAHVDEVGWFVVRPAPVTRFQVSYRGQDGRHVVTPWISL